MGVLDPNFGDLVGRDPHEFANRGPHSEVPSQVPPVPANQPELLNEFAALQQRQQAAVGQHEDFARRMQQVSDAAQSRGADLGLVERLDTMLNPQVPKAARSFLYREMSRSLGLDPSGATTKEVGSMLTSLDPQGAASIRALMIEKSKTSDPGSMQQLVRGIMSGQVPIHEVIKMTGAAEAARAAKTGQGIAEAFGGDENNAGSDAGGTDDLVQKVSQQVSDAEPSGLPRGANAPPERIGKTEIEPKFLGLFGRDISKNQPQTVDEAKAKGYDPITNQADMRKAEAEIREQRNQVDNYFSNAIVLEKVIRGRPEVLKEAGVVARSWESMKAFGQGLFGGNDVDPSSPENKRLVERVVRLAMSGHPDATAETAAIVRSMIVQQGYEIAGALFKQSGRQLQEPDYQRALQTLGASQDPKQLVATMASLGGRIYDVHTTAIRNAVGKDVGMNLEKLSDKQVIALGTSPISPKALALKTEEEMAHRIKERDRKARGEPDPENPPTYLERREQALQQRQQQIEDERQTDRADTKAAAKAHLDISQESLGLAKEREARAERGEARAEQDKRQKAIQAAFQALAKALGTGPGNISLGGGGGGDGGAQDASAFKLPPKTVRQPPQIPSRSRK